MWLITSSCSVDFKLNAKKACMVAFGVRIAASAESVVVVVAMRTERGVLVAVRVIEPYCGSATVAGGCVVFNTICADDLAVQFLIVVVVDECSAVGAVDFVFFHCFSSINSDSQPTRGWLIC